MPVPGQVALNDPTPGKRVHSMTPPPGMLIPSSPKKMKTSLKKSIPYKKRQKMTNAARGGHLDIVRLMLSRGANNYNEAMTRAALRGHLEIVRLMLDQGADAYNEAMTSAALRGHLEIVRLMLDQGANNYNEAMTYAYLYRHINVVELIRERMNPRHLNSLKII